VAIAVERKTCTAPDGVPLVYSAAGAGDPAIVFVHGGLANRGFWDDSLRALAPRHRVLALDLAGHGESGIDRARWGIPEFGADVRAVVEAERLRRAVLFGNSLGGPVAVEAALLLPQTAIGVVGVDTFQSLDYSMSADDVSRRADAFRQDFAGSLRQMVAMLFHRDADPALMADAERRMAGTSPQAVASMFLGMADYRPGPAAARLSVPLRAINGDLYPTDVEGVRRYAADFDVIVMPHTGHYPMLERPAEFNRLVEQAVESLDRSIADTSIPPLNTPR
jgi:pimeloyl-ACP methyl ester carboxylesterase